MKAGKKTAQGLFLKRLQNALWGKTAARPNKERLLINPQTIRAGDIQRATDVFLRRIEVVDDCAHPVWAAYTTSRARILLGAKLHEGLGPEFAWYSDTDGGAALDERTINSGSELGQCENAPVANRRQLAPKVYAEFFSDGRIDSRAKGLRVERGEIPRVGAEYKAARAIRGAKSLQVGGRFFQRSETTRQLNVSAGDRFWKESEVRIDSDGVVHGKTYPRHVKDCP